MSCVRLEFSFFFGICLIFFLRRFVCFFKNFLICFIVCRDFVFILLFFEMVVFGIGKVDVLFFLFDCCWFCIFFLLVVVFWNWNFRLCILFMLMLLMFFLYLYLLLNFFLIILFLFINIFWGLFDFN